MEKIYITKNDFEKLIKLINNKSMLDDYDARLLVELERAEIVDSEKIPADIITMNSHVEFTDVGSGQKLSYWLVFPEKADIKQNKISILSPIGSALIGYQVGDIISLTAPAGQKKLKVEKILYQPEAQGDLT